jgi:hypothetical protein
MEEIVQKKQKLGYVEISLEQMKEFLESQGFIMWKKNANTEWQANKIFNCGENNYLIHVYTSINPNDTSRGVGKDAIRVCVFSSSGKWVFGSKRVNRTLNWKKSIQNRIQELEQRLQKGE